MSRKSKGFVRECAPDPKYGSVILAKFINKIMMGGKKSIAQRIVYQAIEKLAESVQETPIASFEKALKNVLPLMEVRSRRVGGSTYQVPVEVRPTRANSLAMRWIIRFSREKSGKPMADSLFQELLDSYNKVGASMKKREETHKMAEANKAFAHFRW
jgi:small subunit ribosomal protein S7